MHSDIPVVGLVYTS